MLSLKVNKRKEYKDKPTLVKNNMARAPKPPKVGITERPPLDHSLRK